MTYPTASVVVKPESGPSFYGDGSPQDYFHYESYVYGRHYDYEGDSLWFGVDTVKNGSSRMPYTLLSDIPEVNNGDSLIVTASNVPSTIPYASIYQLISGYLTNGYETSQMIRASSSTYVDTLVTASDNPFNFNLLFFQEYRYPDRPGGMWVVPYRAVSAP
jgi:hypothetical protein